MGEVIPLRETQHPPVDVAAELVHGLLEHQAGGIEFPHSPRYGLVIDYDDHRHRYKINGRDVPSVTAVLDSTDPKEALRWWNFRIGLAGVARAVQANQLGFAILSAIDPAVIVKPQERHPDCVLRGHGKRAKWKSRVEALVQDLGLDPYSLMKVRGTIGTSIHLAAEDLGISGTMTKDIEEYPEDDRGQVQALARYWVEQEPEIVLQEVIVGSERFGFAGRFDKVIRMRDGSLRMRDYKTSGGVYRSFDKQLSGYDLAYQDMGLQHQHGPIVGHDVVHLRPDGTYVVVPVTINHADFLVDLLKLLQDRDQAARLKALGRAA